VTQRSLSAFGREAFFVEGENAIMAPSILSGGLARVVDGMTRAQEHWSERRRAVDAAARADEAAPPTPFTIAISREAGTPATSVANEVGRRLGWLVYDQELLERIAQEMGLRTRLLESVDERHVGWIRETMREMMNAVAGAPSVSEDRYATRLIETILSLGMHGECVIVGRGASFILPSTSTLRVKLVAPLATRVKAVSEAARLGEREALAHIQETDRERDRFIRGHFHGDASDPHNYDLVLNSAHLSVADCSDIIIAALKCLAH
jgi:cytidylate kinase